MAEEIKKHRPPPDPNSAKYKLNEIAARAYADAQAAKDRGLTKSEMYKFGIDL